MHKNNKLFTKEIQSQKEAHEKPEFGMRYAPTHLTPNRCAWLYPQSLRMVIPPIAALHWGLFIFNPAGCGQSVLFYPQSLRFIGGYSYSILRIFARSIPPPIASLHWGLFIFSPSDLRS